MTQTIFDAARSTPINTGSLAVPANVEGVYPEDVDAIARLITVWKDHYPKNLIRMGFYTAHNGLKDFGISVPRVIMPS